MEKTPKKKAKPGPTPETVKINDGWEDAVGKALQKERPKDGWPKEDKKSAE